MKSYTDLEQSKKLAEFLPLESADCYIVGNSIIVEPYITYIDGKKHIPGYEGAIPCWSLAALLKYLREIDFFPDIDADEHSVTMSINYYDKDEGKLLNPVHNIKVEAESFIDACVEMIINLKENNVI